VSAVAPAAPPARGRLLLVDDDPVFCRVLGDAVGRRGFQVRIAHDAAAALDAARDAVPTHAVVDLVMPGDSGLTLIPRLREASPDIRIVVLTGYASIATAVEAIKLGAVHYLTKPVDADEVTAAFARADGDPEVPVREAPPSVARVEWEYIQKNLAECRGNVTATARRLNMHRRTLQRKLRKRPSD
jgi:two-component system, response regulator RegA